MEATNLRDAELVSRIKGGDMQSFDTLVEAYFPGTYKRVQMLVPADDAEDVTQDIFLNLMNSIDSFKGRSAFATWFSKIVANKVADYHRKMFRQKNRFASEKMVEYEPSQEADDGLEMDDLLSSLPEHYREVILKKLYYDLSFEEIASELGTSYEAARSLYRRGVKCAAKKIDPDLLHN